jgi:crotonobetaine/carnitine-CoA ligase
MTEEPTLTYFPDVIEYQARTRGDKPFILHEDRVITFAEFDKMTCRVANGLKAQGAHPGDGIAILMGNCPEFLFIFHGVPRAGLYSVPVNTSLKGEGLRYVLSHSDVKYLAVDDVLYPEVEKLGHPLGAIKKVFVRTTTGAPPPEGTEDLSALLDAPADKPEHVMETGAINYILYTSGTTGFPKGVVFRNYPGVVQYMRTAASAMLNPDDIVYTCLPLFHGNALQLTTNWAMFAGIPMALDKRFSASRFWDSIRRYGGTQFNGLGAMIPILMKQPEKPDDADNPVRLVISAACPANLWEAFEKRFGVKIWEGYGAVDGAGSMTNLGNAPVGSVGKPAPGVEWKLADDEGNEVPQGQVGEFVTLVPEGRPRTEYYKDPKASAEKVRGGWHHSGDLFYADEEGNLYFVDRKSDFMRRRGENISSFEVENVIEKHSAVAECAAFGVPSELGEDEVMLWLRVKPDMELDLKDLIRHCAENMAYFMVPRYIDIVDDIPRTETMRVKKGDMKKRGVTERTWDREKEMPDLKLKK